MNIKEQKSIVKEKELTEGLTNRDIYKRKRRTRFWCMACDECIVTPGKKCRRCGARN